MSSKFLRNGSDSLSRACSWRYRSISTTGSRRIDCPWIVWYQVVSHPPGTRSCSILRDLRSSRLPISLHFASHLHRLESQKCQAHGIADPSFGTIGSKAESSWIDSGRASAFWCRCPPPADVLPSPDHHLPDRNPRDWAHRLGCSPWAQTRRSPESVCLQACWARASLASLDWPTSLSFLFAWQDHSQFIEVWKSHPEAPSLTLYLHS